MIDWNQIDTVLLDMDGTLIDRRVEDYFWEEIVPRLYAKKLGISPSEAKADFFRKSDAKRGTPNWGNIGFWEKDLGIKLRGARKKALSGAVLHPHTLRFLKFLRKQKKKIYLVTASDPVDTDVKLIFTKMKGCFDGIYTQPEMRRSKNSVEFWEMLQDRLGFDSSRTMLAEDNPEVLKVARAFGIKWLVFKMVHSSVKPAHTPERFVCVGHFDELIK